LYVTLEKNCDLASVDEYFKEKKYFSTDEFVGTDLSTSTERMRESTMPVKASFLSKKQ
jgi:hypothetical protein